MVWFVWMLLLSVVVGVLSVVAFVRPLRRVLRLEKKCATPTNMVRPPPMVLEKPVLVARTLDEPVHHERRVRGSEEYELFEQRWKLRLMIEQPYQNGLTDGVRFAICIPYYNNWIGLRNHLHAVVNLPSNYRPHFVIADDGSREDPLRDHVPYIRNLVGDDATLLELEDDIGYNTAGAFNTAWRHIPPEIDVVFMTGVDLYMSAQQVLLWRQLAAHIVQKPTRVFWVWGPGISMMHKQLWQEWGWFNEAVYGGSYGWEDCELGMRLRQHNATYIKAPKTFIDMDVRAVTSTKLPSNRLEVNTRRHREHLQQYAHSQLPVPTPSMCCRVPYHIIAASSGRAGFPTTVTPGATS